jgi:hypothetical protein
MRIRAPTLAWPRPALLSTSREEQRLPTRGVAKPDKLVVVLALALIAGCGEGEHAHRNAARTGTMPDPRQLVVQLADLPSGYGLVAGETFSTPLASVLGDPGSGGYETLIRRERIGGYQTSVWTPDHRRIECSAAVYRSRRSARLVFGLRSAGVRGLTRTESRSEQVGEETRILRFEQRGPDGLSVRWRYRSVLAACTSVGRERSDLGHILAVARAQQERISRALG